MRKSLVPAPCAPRAESEALTLPPLQLKRAPPYGFLYHKQLQSLFRQCGQVKSVVFDGAK